MKQLWKIVKPDPPILFYRTMNVKLCDEDGNVIDEENTKDLKIKFETTKGEKTDNIAERRKYAGNGIHKISYLVIKPGDYSISVFICDEHVEGSPFTLSIKE